LNGKLIKILSKSPLWGDFLIDGTVGPLHYTDGLCIQGVPGNGRGTVISRFYAGERRFV